MNFEERIQKLELENAALKHRVNALESAELKRVAEYDATRAANSKQRYEESLRAYL